MQKIQTPSGPQLIAVPIGQTIIQGPNGGQLVAQAGQNIITNNVQFQPNITLSSASFLASSQAPGQSFTLQSSQAQIGNTLAAIVSSTPTLVSLPALNTLSGNVITHQSVIQQNTTPISSTNNAAAPISTTNNLLSSPVSPTKKKKPKKKKKDEDLPNKSQGVVDLGALMKDVGLDFGADDFGFGMDSGSQQQDLNNSLNSSQNSSSSDLEADLSASESTIVSASVGITNNLAQVPNTITTNIGQIPTTVSSNIGSLPSSIPVNFAQLASQPQIQATIPTAAVQLQGGGGATVQLAGGQVQGAGAVSGIRVANPLVPGQVGQQAQSLQLVQGPDGNFILQTNPTANVISKFYVKIAKKKKIKHV